MEMWGEISLTLTVKQVCEHWEAMKPNFLPIYV